MFINVRNAIELKVEFRFSHCNCKTASTSQEDQRIRAAKVEGKRDRDVCYFILQMLLYPGPSTYFSFALLRLQSPRQFQEAEDQYFKSHCVACIGVKSFLQHAIFRNEMIIAITAF